MLQLVGVQTILVRPTKPKDKLSQDEVFVNVEVKEPNYDLLSINEFKSGNTDEHLLDDWFQYQCFKLHLLEDLDHFNHDLQVLSLKSNWVFEEELEDCVLIDWVVLFIELSGFLIRRHKP